MTKTQRRSILVGTSSFAEMDKAPLHRLEKEKFDIVFNPYKRKLTKDELRQLLSGKIGVIAGLETYDEEILRTSQLKVVSRCGAGVSNVDQEKAKKLKIKVFSTPDAPTNSVAELTLANILNLLRQIPQTNQQLHQGKWNRVLGYELSGKTILIIGFGRIGRRLAQLLKPFGVEILVHDPFVKKLKGFKKVELKSGLGQADIITLHTNTEECILSSREFAFIKKGAYVCNAARGTVVDEQSLIRALESGIIAGCWFDTFGQEPYQGELLKYPQAILTSHIGSFTRECRSKMEMEAVENLIKGLKG